MVKKSKEALRNALIQAEKHGISDTFYLAKSDKGFYISYSREKESMSLYSILICVVSNLNMPLGFIEFLEVL